MASQPIQAGVATTNVHDEEVYKVRVTFGSAAVASYLAKNAVFARTGVGTFTITLDKPYTEITDFKVGMKDATGATLGWVITSSAIDTTGVVTLASRVAAGTDTEPASGDVAYITLGVSSSNLNAKYGG